MSKPFDSLRSALLINKLKAFGVSEEPLGLMKSHFINRQNRVKLNGTTSIWKDFVRGCSQGTSFGPLLWNIYHNDLTYLVNNTNLSVYADDHQLYVICAILRNKGKDNSAVCVHCLVCHLHQVMNVVLS